MFDLNNLLRNNIKNLTPYSSARDEYKGKQGIFLDANENSNGSPLPANYNRYPDPLQLEVKNKLSVIKGVPPENIFIGNGSDEAIDLLFRAFCNPQKDNVIICPPTYGMYEVCAAINDVEIRRVNLTPDFQLNIELISEAADENTKLIFICSPNNPTGNSIDKTDIEIVLNNFEGLVVIDEAYINYSRQKTCISELTEYPNLVILQTLSKAWGLAGLRVGIALAGEEIISVLNKIKYPYNINSVSQKLASEALDNIAQINEWIKETVSERDKITSALAKLPFVLKIFPSDANFLLVKTTDPIVLYEYLIKNEIVVRDRSRVELCEGCLRITIGTKQENSILLGVLAEFGIKSK